MNRKCFILLMLISLSVVFLFLLHGIKSFSSPELLAADEVRQVKYYGVDNVNNVSDFDTLKQYGVNIAQVVLSESDLSRLNTYIQKAEQTGIALIVWPIGPHFCGANCIPWDYSGGNWVIDEAVKPLLNRLSDWEKNGQGSTLLVGINAFQEPHNDGISIDQQAALAAKIKNEYGIPVADWIDNVVDTGVSSNSQWLSLGANAIDWPITWTHCIPYYQGSGGNTCTELTCELANPSNPTCCVNQWAASCSQKCYGPEGTCAYGLDKIRRDRAIVGEVGNYGVLLQAFEMPSYNNAHLPTADQMYEEACRVAKSGVVDMIIWYDWDRSYGGYTSDLHSARYDSYGGDRWAAMKRIYDECIKSSSPTITPTPSPSLPCFGANNTLGADDVIAWAGKFGQSYSAWEVFGDNQINGLEFGFLVKNWGKSCGL